VESTALSVDVVWLALKFTYSIPNKGTTTVMANCQSNDRP
jgi:hypothetical protein